MVLKRFFGTAAQRAASTQTGNAGDLWVEADTGLGGVADGTTLLKDLYPAVYEGTVAPRWRPNWKYRTGQMVTNPFGEVVKARLTFTSGTTYSAANWARVGPSHSSGVANQLHAKLRAGYSAVAFFAGDSTMYDDIRAAYRFLTEYLMPLYPLHQIDYWLWNVSTHTYASNGTWPSSGYRMLRAGQGGRTVTDGVVNGNADHTVITSATANFTNDDVGRTINGAAGLPAVVTITEITNSTTARIDAVGAGSATGVTMTITPQILTFYNAAAPGAGAGETTAFMSLQCPKQPDLIVVNYGHNHNANSFMGSYYRPMLDALMTTFGPVPTAIIAQNPNTSVVTNPTRSGMDNIANQCAAEAKARGMDLIDIWSLYYEVGDGTETSWGPLNKTDGIHPLEGTDPATSGVQLWLNELVRKLGADRRGYAPPPVVPQETSFLVEASRFLPTTTTGPYLLADQTGGFPYIAFAKSVNQYAAAKVKIPSTWKTWTVQVMATVGSNPPAGQGAGWGVFTLQPTYPIDQNSANGPAMAANGTVPARFTGHYPGEVRIIKTHAAWTSGASGAVYQGTGEHLVMVQRLGTNVSDSLAQDAWFLGLRYTRVT